MEPSQSGQAGVKDQIALTEATAVAMATVVIDIITASHQIITTTGTEARTECIGMIGR